MSIDDSAFLQMAAQVASAGHLDIAKQTVTDLLAHSDTNPEAHRLLGKIEFSLGDVAAGSAAMKDAIRLAPDRADLRYEFGTMLAAKGDIAGAYNELLAAVELEPDNQDYLYNLGCTLSTVDEHQTAAAVFQRVLELDPTYARAWQNLGYSHLALAAWEEAASAFAKAVEMDPSSHDAVIGLGVALRGAGRDEDADALLAENAERDPSGQAVLELSNFELRRSQGKDVTEILYAAHRADPKNPEPLVKLAVALDRTGRLPEIVLPLMAAAIDNPEHGQLMCLAGIALVKIGELNDQAESVLLRGCALLPHHAGAKDALAHLYFARGDIEKAVQWYYAAHKLNPTNASIHSNFLFTLRHSSIASPEEVFEAHKEYGQLQEGLARPLPLPVPIAADRDRRLRLGFVSPDFCVHVVMMFFEPYLDHIDREKFEVFLYYTNGHQDKVTERVKAKADGWRHIVSLSYEDSATLVQEDKIDILIDLAGHTAKNGLPIFAHKPAPLQMTWIGYPGTTGLTRMDYRFGNPADQPFATEKILPVEVAFRPPENTPAVAPQHCLTGAPFTFACLNKTLKASPQAFECWAHILEQVPGSRFIMMAGASEVEPTVQRVVPIFERHGVDPARIIIRQHMPQRDFLQFMSEIDLALDPFPYGGGTTARLCAWMGLPYVTLLGEGTAGRSAARVLQLIDLMDFVAATPEEYVAIAIAKARDPHALAALRPQLRERLQASPLMMEGGLTRHFEHVLRELWIAHVDKAMAGEDPIVTSG